MLDTMTTPRRKKPKGRKGGGKPTSPREAFHLSEELREALEAFVAQTDPPTTKTATIVAALKEYLSRRGAWPPSGPAK